MGEESLQRQELHEGLWGFSAPHFHRGTVRTSLTSNSTALFSLTKNLGRTFQGSAHSLDFGIS